MIPAIQANLSRRVAGCRAALAGALAGAIALAGCGGSIDGGLEMKSQALQVDPPLVAPVPQGTGTFTLVLDGDSEGDRYQAEIYVYRVLADQFVERGEVYPLIRTECLKSSCGRVVRIACTLGASNNVAASRRIECVDPLGNRGLQDVAPGDYRVTANFRPGLATGYDDDIVDSNAALRIE